MKNPKKKLLLLTFGIVIALFLGYQLSFKKAIHEMQRNTVLTQLETQSFQFERDLQQWQQKSLKMDQQLGSSGTLGFEEQLLNTVGLFAEDENLAVHLFSEPLTGEKDGFSIETIEVTVRGGFHELLSLLNHLETTFKAGRIASANFETKTNYKKGRNELYLKVYVQHIKPLKE